MAKLDKDETAQNADSANTGSETSSPSNSASAAEAGAAPEETPEQAPAEDDIVAEAEKVLDDVELDADALAAAAAEALTKAQDEVAEWKDKYLRLHAEWDTYRRRTDEQRKVEKARAAEKLVGNLIPVIDDFERTIDYAEKNGEGDLLDGVKAVHTKMLDVLGKDGVEVINPVDEPFDALEHQAVATVPDEEAYDETVKQVYQKGYKIGGKVLRAAMVVVSTGGPARPKPADDAEQDAE